MTAKWKLLIGLVVLQCIGYAALAYGVIRLVMYLIDYAKR